MFKPLDVLVRVSAIPHIAWSTSGSILEMRHRIADAFKRDPESPYVTSMLEGLFDRIEDQCRTRWDGLFDAADDRRVA